MERTRPVVTTSAFISHGTFVVAGGRQEDGVAVRAVHLIAVHAVLCGPGPGAVVSKFLDFDICRHAPRRAEIGGGCVVGRDVERGGDVECVEPLVAVRRADVARDRHRVVVADGRAAGERGCLAALRQGVAEMDAVLVAAPEGVARARPGPDVEPLRLALRPYLHEVEAHAELGVVEVHHVVAVGLHGHGAGVERGGALLAAVARPDVLGAHAHPWADGEVDSAAGRRRLPVAPLRVEVTVPHAGGPGQTALRVNAPRAVAQLAVQVTRRRAALHGGPVLYASQAVSTCPRAALAGGPRLCADGDDRGEQRRQTHSCPSAAKRPDGRFC